MPSAYIQVKSGPIHSTQWTGHAKCELSIENLTQAITTTCAIAHNELLRKKKIKRVQKRN